MQIGISTASFYPMHVEKALRWLAEHDVKNTEIFLNSGSELYGAVFDEIISIIRDYSLNVISFHPITVTDTLYLFSGYDRRKDEYLEQYKVYFDRMNMMGAKILVFHGALHTSHCPEERYFERFAELYDLGVSFGVTVSQENIVYCKSKDLKFLKRMSAALKEKARFTLDIKQAVRAGASPFDFLCGEIRDKIIHIHASDHGPEGDCLKIGYGGFDFKTFFDKLKGFRYNGAVILELYREDYDGYEELIESANRLAGYIF